MVRLFLNNIFGIFRSANWIAKSMTYEENCEYKRNNTLSGQVGVMLYFVCLCVYLHYVFISFSVKPTLKKVSKYENKFAKLQKKAAEFNFRNQLKVVKKKEFTLEEEDKEVRNIIAILSCRHSITLCLVDV